MDSDIAVVKEIGMYNGQIASMVDNPSDNIKVKLYRMGIWCFGKLIPHVVQGVTLGITMKKLDLRK